MPVKVTDQAIIIRIEAELERLHAWADTAICLINESAPDDSFPAVGVISLLSRRVKTLARALHEREPVG